MMRPAVFIALMPMWLGIAAVIFYVAIGRKLVAKERAGRLAREAERNKAKPPAD